jgi:hypothetical protein
MIVHCKDCMMCGGPSEFDIPDARMWEKAVMFVEDRYGFGNVQDEFPKLTAGQREQLVTGTHPACWETLR